MVARARARAQLHRSVVPGADRGSGPGGGAGHRWRLRVAGERAPARAEAQGLFRCAPGAPHGPDREDAARRRHSLACPVYKRVDTCAAEFATSTAYLYSTYEEECEAEPDRSQPKIMILGGGPNRIGQGIEFDYCCVHASLALREDGYETIMVNCNPETVSTDYDTSDRLYFEPLTLEDVLEIIDKEKPVRRDRAVRRADAAEAVPRARGPAHPSSAPRPRRSTWPRTASASRSWCERLQLRQPPNATARTEEQAMRWRGSRLPAGGASVLRARRPRDGSGLSTRTTCARPT
jgi:hypothetical protein